LEDVGRDTYHHTFFEMLGTWSFGDYFKKEAINFAYQLLTQQYQLDPERLYATYFEGDDNVSKDVEARDYWLQYLPPSRVIGCAAADNFWEMGDTGPCGPCSEIHYDRIGDRDASALVNADDPNVLEIWNLVFIQYNTDAKTGLTLLPQQHIDTGMGLERLVSILQKKQSNYDTDAFSPIFEKLEELSKVGPYEGKLGNDDPTLKDTAYRVISDHIRTLSFAIADGAVPNNEGRGYVLRRILRRATRYGQQILKAEPGFFQQLVPVVVENFKEAYPELLENEATILDVISEEEAAFSSMLTRGIKFFEQINNSHGQIPAKEVFFLYDTLGFPLDLTELMAEEAGLTVDTQGFHKEMQKQQKRSREARALQKTGEGAQLLELIAEQTAALQKNNVLPTDDSYKYHRIDLPTNIMSIFGNEGFYNNEESANPGDFVGIILEKSSFYPEGGGQEADLGFLSLLDKSNSVVGIFEVQDVQSYGGFLLHKGIVKQGNFKVGQKVHCRVDYERRSLVEPNHSMTHVLNAALRQVLGDKVDQRGSLVNDEKLRFDFTHKKALTQKQLQKTEEICQQIINNSLGVTTTIMPLTEAQAIN